MGRYRAIYDTNGLLAEFEDGKLAWHRGDKPKKSKTGCPQVIRDIPAYKSMITGEMIDGRTQHREHLKRHNCAEVGNETSFLDRPKAATPMRSNRETLHRVLADVSDRQINQIVQTELRNRR